MKQECMNFFTLLQDLYALVMEFQLNGINLKQKYGLAEDFVNKLQASNILYTRNNGEYFQIYSAPIFDGFFFEIVERRDQYQGYGSRNASARLAAQSNYKQADRTAYV